VEVTHRALAVLLFVVVGSGACGQASDVAVLQDEALAVARSYQERVEALVHRASMIQPGELTELTAQRTFQQAASTLVRARSDLRQLPGQIQASAKASEPEAVRALYKLIGDLRQRIDRGVIQAGADLSAVESWIAQADLRPRSARAAGTPAPGAGEPAVDPGSGAPIQ
jgi:hypothetical protein